MKSQREKAAKRSLSHLSFVSLVYLWPFFAVWSFNAPPWWGENRNNANRFNGLLCLSLLDFIALLTLLPGGLLHMVSRMGAIAIFVPLIGAHWYWLDGKRGEELKARFHATPARIRWTAAIASAAIFGALVIWFFTRPT